jgi:hypothetical protein
MGTSVFYEPDAQILYPENGGTRVLRNVEVYLQDYTTSHVR